LEGNDLVSGFAVREPLADPRLNAYLKAAIDSVIMADASGLVVEFNPAAEETFGYTREQAIGSPLAELIVPPSLREKHRRAFKRFIETREQQLFGRRMQLTGMRSNGDEFPVELTLGLVESEPVLVCGALRDLSEAKRAEGDLRRLADEQGALSRVATLVARGAEAAEVFARVAEEVAHVLDAPLIGMARFEPDGSSTLIGTWGSGDPLFVPGLRLPPHPGLWADVRTTGRPARVESYASLSGEIAAELVAGGMQTGFGVPIVVNDTLWGVISALGTNDKPLSEDVEDRLTSFTALIATALSNTQALDDLQRLAAEQAALRRVAVLVAEGAPPDEVFAAVAQEVARLLDVPAISMVRFEPDETSIAIAVWGDENPFGVGATFEPWPGVMLQVRQTGRPARLEDYAYSTGPTTARLLAARIHSGAGVPISVDGRVWGTIIALATGGESLPAGIETRLSAFTELVATAIANTEARDDVRRLADEQAALRRVATQVAQGAEPRAVFDLVCQEAGLLFGATSTNLAHFTSDGFNLTMSGWSLHDTHVPTGTRLPLQGDTINVLVQRTAAPGRFDSYEGSEGELAALLRARGVRSEVGAPVSVKGTIWGALIAGWDTEESPPPGIEHRVARFAELIGTAVSNASNHAQLLASRARIVAAADEARRRIERNLHDGTQQKLVALGLDLQALKSTIPSELYDQQAEIDRIHTELDAVIDDVREISRGVHPALLSHAGLGAALKALARRSPIPVEAKVDAEPRLSQSIEIAAYYAASEALANAAKHSRASVIHLAIEVSHDCLRMSISDDGIGGATIETGAGLMGLVDRVEALGGDLSLQSVRGHGTSISIALPLDTPISTA
jgi:PAS domain S-box-containing protein